MKMVSVRLVLLIVGQVYLAQAGTVKNNEACSTTTDCEDNKGLECKFSYTTCEKGKCLCPTGKTYDATNGCETTEVTTELYLGDACTDTSQMTVTNAECSNSEVKCTAGFTAKGNAFCRSATDKVLGETCTASTDKCNNHGDKVVPSITGISCQAVSGTDKCACSAGYIQDDTSCREKTVGDTCSTESGCTKTNQECSSGSDPKCKCVADTELSDGMCQVKGTVTEGNVCTYSPNLVLTNKATTCSIGLVCGECPETTDGTNKCLKPSSGSAVNPTLFHVAAAICVALFGRKMI